MHNVGRQPNQAIHGLSMALPKDAWKSSHSGFALKLMKLGIVNLPVLLKYEALI